MAIDLSAETVSDLIGDIYHCALEPENWPAALARLRALLGFEHATISLQTMPTGRVLFNFHSGIPSPWLERIGDYGEDIVALWGGTRAIAAAPIEQPAVLSRMNPAVGDGTSDNRYYTEWRRPQGLIDTVAIGLIRDDTALAAASLVRHERQGPIAEADLERVRFFAPHLRRAVTISRLLDGASLAAATFEAVLDGLAMPLVVVDGGARLLHANAAARAMIERGDPFRVRDDLLSLADPAAARALPGMLAAVREPAASACDLPIRLADGSAAALHLRALTLGTLRWGVPRTGTVAIILSEAASGTDSIPGLARRLLDLSPSEARVFEAVARGEPVTAIAAAEGVSVSTIRTHLLRIFEKSGVHRQIDVMKLAQAFRSPLSGA
ncbi:helix-turn-helix transcriptional regulator [Sphingomonas adhaesiva]|uniref:helix-turn-helix transcriptional regulator n=1 Tax=Sphingomonas adhaesiva TaxID=28212 RepID=UPI002FFA9BD1